MKKYILSLLLFLISVFALVAKPLKIGDGVVSFASNLEGRLISSSLQFVPGINFAIDYLTSKKINLGGYFRFEYPLSPLGNNNCGVATLELFEEFGATITSVIHSFNNFNKIKLCVDLGYYIQLLHLLGYRHFTAGYNGLIFRPKISLTLAKIFNIPFEVGVYYQLASIPSYDRYNGLGMFLKI